MKNISIRGRISQLEESLQHEERVPGSVSVTPSDPLSVMERHLATCETESEWTTLMQIGAMDAAVPPCPE